MDNEVLRLHLQQTLPDYMMPVAFKRLESLPLTSNGKVDRRTLEHMLVSIESSQKYVAPSNDIEKELVNIWALVLNLKAEDIGVNDNFFELGGHSLLATQLLSKIRSQFEIDLPLKAIFAFNTLADIGEVINVTQIQQKQSLALDEVVEYEDISL